MLPTSASSPTLVEFGAARKKRSDKGNDYLSVSPTIRHSGSDLTASSSRRRQGNCRSSGRAAARPTDSGPLRGPAQGGASLLGDESQSAEHDNVSVWWKASI
jgi:hypothetical protein